MQYLHIMSYLEDLFINLCKYVYHDDKIMKFARYHHNILLSVLSGIMLVMITIGNYQTGKFNSMNDFLCTPYYDNWYANTSAKMFLWSKYLEWGDSFLCTYQTSISMLMII